MLVRRAKRWLMKTKGCSFVLSELSTCAGEIPDAVGWKVYSGESFLIECKASKSDFSSDLRKPFRCGDTGSIYWIGMGNYRYYMVPFGLVSVDEMPEKWGLLYVYKTKVVVVKEAMRIHDLEVCKAEQKLLLSALRRVHLRGDLKKIYEPLKRCI